MSDWLHWIGKPYYTMHSFTKEAEKFGVSRRISLQTAKQMNWGDTVYCAMLDGKTGVIFGYFKISITGLSPETVALILGDNESSLLDYSHSHVERGCGEYEAGPTWSTTASLEEIIGALDDKQNTYPNDDKLMIGGPFTETSRTRLLDIPFRQGFRKFCVEAFYAATIPYIGKVHGQFYIRADAEVETDNLTKSIMGGVQQVNNYTQNPNSRKKRKKRRVHKC